MNTEYGTHLLVSVVQDCPNELRLDVTTDVSGPVPEERGFGRAQDLHVPLIVRSGFEQRRFNGLAVRDLASAFLAREAFLELKPAGRVA